MLIKSHKELEVYQLAFDAAMEIFDLTRNFPKEELYSLTDQIRRSSRSVCSNIAESYRKRKYPKSFTAGLNISEGESAETQVWLDFSRKCNYISSDVYKSLNRKYDFIIGKLVIMSLQPDKWSF